MCLVISENQACGFGKKSCLRHAQSFFPLPSLSYLQTPYGVGVLVGLLACRDSDREGKGEMMSMPTPVRTWEGHVGIGGEGSRWSWVVVFFFPMNDRLEGIASIFVG